MVHLGKYHQYSDHIIAMMGHAAYQFVIDQVYLADLVQLVGVRDHRVPLNRGDRPRSIVWVRVENTVISQRFVADVE